MKKIFCLITTIIFILSNLNSLSLAKYVEKNKEEYLNLDFWKTFNDELLIDNIKTGYSNNLDLKIATLKVRESEKIVKLSLAQELPTIDFNPLIGRIFSSSDLKRGSNNFQIKSYRQTRFLLPVEVSYEIDIWGKNRLKTKSKKQSLKIIEQDEKTAYIMLTSSIASNYYNLIKIDKYIELENEMLELAKNYEAILQNKQTHGLASSDEVLEANKFIIQIEANINNLTIQKEVVENQMGYLLGDKLFSKIKRNDFSNIKEIRKIPEVLNSEIILNRPDVIASSENIIRANYDAGIAKRDLLPTFVIQGTFGFNGYNNLAGIFKNHTGLAEAWIMPKWNIFDAGKRYNTIGLKKLELERAKKEYEQSVLSSIQEINDNLATLKSEDKNYSLSKKVLDIQTEKLNLKEKNTFYGLSNQLELISYKQAQLLAKKEYVNNKINKIIAYINLYKACGGVDFNKISL